MLSAFQKKKKKAKDTENKLHLFCSSKAWLFCFTWLSDPLLQLSEVMDEIRLKQELAAAAAKWNPCSGI